jgi:hypothetical protein
MAKIPNPGLVVTAKALNEEPSAKKARTQAAGREETGRLMKGQKADQKDELLGKGTRG